MSYVRLNGIERASVKIRRRKILFKNQIMEMLVRSQRGVRFVLPVVHLRSQGPCVRSRLLIGDGRLLDVFEVAGRDDWDPCP